MDYYKYIQSDEWKFKSKAMKWIANYRCQVCNNKDDKLDTHHRTYDNLGRETPSDLIVLCRSCHELYHNNKSEDCSIKSNINTTEQLIYNRMNIDNIHKLKLWSGVEICGFICDFNERPTRFVDIGDMTGTCRLYCTNQQLQDIIIDKLYNTGRKNIVILVSGRFSNGSAEYPIVIPDTITDITDNIDLTLVTNSLFQGLKL